MSSDIQETVAGLNKIEGKPKAETLRAKAGAYFQAGSGILVTLIAVFLVSLLFLSQSVASSLSRK